MSKLRISLDFTGINERIGVYCDDAVDPTIANMAVHGTTTPTAHSNDHKQEMTEQEQVAMAIAASNVTEDPELAAAIAASKETVKTDQYARNARHATAIAAAVAAAALHAKPHPAAGNLAGCGSAPL